MGQRCDRRRQARDGVTIAEVRECYRPGAHQRSVPRRLRVLLLVGQRSRRCTDVDRRHRRAPHGSDCRRRPARSRTTAPSLDPSPRYRSILRRAPTTPPMPSGCRRSTPPAPSRTHRHPPIGTAPPDPPRPEPVRRTHGVTSRRPEYHANCPVDHRRGQLHRRVTRCRPLLRTPPPATSQPLVFRHQCDAGRDRRRRDEVSRGRQLSSDQTSPVEKSSSSSSTTTRTEPSISVATCVNNHGHFPWSTERVASGGPLRWRSLPQMRRSRDPPR